jgi:hypothetical protein
MGDDLLASFEIRHAPPNRWGAEGVSVNPQAGEQVEPATATALRL